MSTLQSDGLLRLRQQDLSGITLVHLISGIDDEPVEREAPACGAGTTLSGYTEWMSTQEPRLSLGWDWQFEPHPSSQRVVRLGLPRTNALMLSGERVPLPWDESLQMLASFIDTIDWNTPAFNAVCERYAA